jgi:hypothetical protein
MKAIWYGLVVASLAALGCVSLPTLTPAVKPARAAETAEGRTEPPRAPKPSKKVTPDQVTEENGLEAVKLLQDELDRDQPPAREE